MVVNCVTKSVLMNRFSFFLVLMSLTSVLLGQITTTSNFSTFSTCSGTASNAQSFTFSVVGGSGNVSISAPTGYEVSFSASSSYATAITTASISGTAYVRLTSSATGTPSGNVQVARTNLTTVNIAVSGVATMSFPNGNSLAFDGVDDYVSVSGTSNATTLAGSQSFTVEAWVYPTAWKTNYWEGPIVDNTQSGDGNYALRVGDNGTVGFTIANGWNNETVISGQSLTLNSWSHLSGTYNHTTKVMSVYINGNLIASKTNNQWFNTPVNPTGTLFIGATTNWARYFAGRIDELRIWNRVLTPAEIQAGMNAPLTGNESNLMAYYQFNQGVSGGANTAVTSLLNSASASTGANGTLTNFALTNGNSTSNWVASVGHQVSGATTLCAGGGTSTYTTTASGGTWSSSNTAVATVNASTGVVTPVAAGTASIIYTYTSGSCSLTPSLPITVSAGPTVAATTPGSRCSSGNVTLSATASSAGATLTWYNQANGGSSLGTGTNYTALNIAATTTYYVDASENGCTSARTAVVATVLPALPTITTTSGKICGSGSSTLVANATNMSSSDIRWYTQATGGSALVGPTHPSNGTSNLVASFSAGEIGTTKTYYVEAQNACGTTSSRQTVTATSYVIPASPVTTSGTRCGTGTVDLTAAGGANIGIRWYDYIGAGMTLLGTGTTYTPTVSATTTFYAEAYNTLADAANLTCSSASPATATVNSTATWNGTGNWSDATKWSCGSGTTPTGLENIVVSSGTLTLSSDVTMTTLKTLSVNSGATLAIAPAYALTIPAGAVLSNSGTVLVDANSGNQGQLLLMGTYTKVGSGAVTVRRAYNVSSAPAYAKWIQISAPVDADLTSLGTVQANNLFYWNASNNNWTATAGATKFEAGKGYTAYYGPNGVTTTQSGTIELSGSPFVNPVIPTIAWSNGASNNALFYSTEKSGWNLVGNPLTSNLDFSAFSTGNGRNNVENSFYRWDPNKGGPGQAGYHAHAYTSADGNNNTIIPPLTAVWVRATSNSTPRLGNGNIGFSTHGHRNGTKPFTNTSKTDPDKFLVSVSDLASPLLKDNLSLAMIPGASDAFDGELDAWELLNSNELPNVYANFNEEWTTAKAVDFSTTSSVEKVIPVGVKSTQEMRPYRMHLNADLAQEGYTIYLKDRLLKNVHNLSTSDYVFAYTSAMEDRFELILTNAKTGALGLEEASRGALTAWVSGSELWITGLESGAQEIDVVGMDGRVVLSAQLRAEEGQPVTTSLPELPAGLYTVRVRANGMERGVRFAVQR